MSTSPVASPVRARGRPVQPASAAAKDAGASPTKGEARGKRGVKGQRRVASDATPPAGGVRVVPSNNYPSAMDDTRPAPVTFTIRPPSVPKAKVRNILPPQTERDFTQQVLQAARALGWLCYHTWRSDHSEAGFPDLVMVKGEVLIFAELKTYDRRGNQKRLTAEQSNWLAALGQSVAEAYVWRPKDWSDIVRKLGGEG